ncbi:MAG: choice-of-anchor X domain-containing protein, partial [Verrucomicrobiota bacterium]
PVQKLEAAQQAAIFYVDTVRSDDRIGLVSFSGDGTEPGPVDDATAIDGKMFPGVPVVRLLMKIGISTFTAGGWTSIGDGLSISQDIIDADTTTGELIDTILLLSDGQQNEALLWDDGSSIRNRFAGSPGNDTIINTIAFGPEADLNLMSDIADATDGQASYIEVDVPDAGDDVAADDAADAGDAADADDAGDAAASSPSMFLRLAGAYLAGSEKAQRSERLVYLENEIGPSDNQTYELDLQDHSVEQGTLYIYWDGDAGALDVTVLDPNGSEITVAEADILPPNYDNNERHKVWQMNVTLEHGIYEVQVENTTGDNVRFFAGISGRPENHAKCWLGFSSYLRAKLLPEDPIRQRFGIGQPVTLLAFLTDAGGVVEDADVRVQITLPTRALACGPTQLFDDGAHNDGQAGDGVYGNVFRQTLWGQSNGNDTDNGGQLSPPEASGAYNVFMTVDGTANDGTPFHREKASTFTVYEEIEVQGTDFDEDMDGLPSAWEISQRTNPKVADDQEDPDEDGLTNMEEYLQGTLAHNPDTDDGGESDGSEVAAGRCPLNPDDDTMRFSNQLAVLSKTGGVEDAPTVQPVPDSNHIRFTRSRSWEFLELQRAPTAKGPWMTIQTIDMSAIDQPVVEDPGLVAGTDYFYRMRGTRTSTGATTQWSNVARGTPWSAAEIFGPQGHLAINNGAATTDVPELMLHLGYNPDVIDMRLSHLSGFPGSPWQQVNPTATYTVPGLGPGDPVQPITMYVQLRNAAGYVSGDITDEILYDPSTVGNPDNDGDGINDDKEVFVFFTDPDNPDSDGDGITDGDEVAGGTNPLSNDSDNEGLTDGEELLAGTDPSVADTDGDSHSDREEIEVLMTDPNDPEDALVLVSFNQADASSADLTFASKAGVTYHFMVTDDLTNWVDVETSVVATGSSTTLTIPYPIIFDPTTTERIYVLVKVLDD